MPRPPTARGYTLVEMLITITILGILGSMVVPNLSGSNALRTQAAVRSVVADITFAQSDALAYQQARAVVFNPAENYYTLTEYHGSTPDPDADALYDAQRQDQRYRVSLDDARFGGVTLENVSFNAGDVLIFDELGGPAPDGSSTATSTGGSLEVVGPTTRWRITVAPFTGRVTVQQLE